MKLYFGIGPSARIVRLFMQEKKLSLETVELDLMRGEHLSEEFLRLNPGGQIPFLTLEDGTVIAESLAICEYLEEVFPELPLVGSSAVERAETRMWCRRIDLRIMEPAIQSFKATVGYEFFKNRYVLVRSGAEELKALSDKNLEWLEQQMQGRSYICGERFSLADIQLWCFLDHQRAGGAAVPERLTALGTWFSHVAERVSSHRGADKLRGITMLKARSGTGTLT